MMHAKWYCAISTLVGLSIILLDLVYINSTSSAKHFYHNETITHGLYTVTYNASKRMVRFPPDTGVLRWSNVTSDKESVFYNLDFQAEIDKSVKGSPLDHLPNFKSPCWFVQDEDAKEKLRCFPAAFLLGFPKCGTTDLYNALVKHPSIVQTGGKELQYWNIRRCGSTKRYGPFSDYMNHFDKPSERILHSGQRDKNSTEGGIYYDKLTFDGTPSTVYQFWGWDRVPANKGQEEPHVVTAHAIHAINPDAKLILMVREPADRAYSHFRYFVTSRSVPSSTFEVLVDKLISAWEKCRQNHSVRSCAYTDKLDTIPETLCATHRSNEPCLNYLRASLYSIYIADWLSLFPKNQIHVIKAENYYKDKVKVVKDVWSFLDLPEADPDIIRSIKTARVANTKKGHSANLDPMLKSTRTKLRTFYAPFVRDLAFLMDDDEFRWDYT